MKSQAQRRYLWAKEPDLAREFENATPKGKKLPAKVKKAFVVGAADALEQFGMKQAAVQIRLKISPRREFHGWDEAFRSTKPPDSKRAGVEGTADGLAQLLLQSSTPKSPLAQVTAKDPLDRSTAWGAPSNLAGGDTVNRISAMGQSTSPGTVF